MLASRNLQEWRRGSTHECLGGREVLLGEEHLPPLLFWKSSLRWQQLKQQWLQHQHQQQQQRGHSPCPEQQQQKDHQRLFS